MLEALLAVGVRPDLVVGASVGAINGVHFAADPTPAGVQRLRSIWQDLTRDDVFPLSLVRVLLSLGGWRPSLLDSARLRQLLERSLTMPRLEGTVIPCHVTATDALDGAEVILSAGPTIDALLASAAIPVLFPPVERAGRLLVDGGVASNTPIAAAVALGAQRIVVLPTGFSCALVEPPQGPIAMAVHALNLLIARQLVADIERFASRVDIVVVPPLCPLSRSSYDFSHGTAIMDRARASTASWLAEGGLTRPGQVPRAMAPHTHAMSEVIDDAVGGAPNEMVAQTPIVEGASASKTLT